jgi:hypothetical protein
LAALSASQCRSGDAAQDRRLRRHVVPDLVGIKATIPSNARIYVAWVRGVLTGHNYANQNQQVSAISSGTVEQYVESLLQLRNHSASFSDAALRLTDRFSGRNTPITK